MMQGRDGGRWQLWAVARAKTGVAVGLILTGHAVPEVDRDVKLSDIFSTKEIIYDTAKKKQSSSERRLDEIQLSR